MDSTSGLNMAVIGITTVFLALSMLVAIVSGMARMLGDKPPAAAAAAAPTQPGTPTGPDPRLRAVALAAFALHHHVTRRRRFTPLVAAEAGTPWIQAARAEQASALPTRG